MDGKIFAGGLSAHEQTSLYDGSRQTLLERCENARTDILNRLENVNALIALLKRNQEIQEILELMGKTGVY